METYGFPEAMWQAAKRKVKNILAARAKARGMIPYSDLAAKVTCRGGRPTARG